MAAEKAKRTKAKKKKNRPVVKWLKRLGWLVLGLFVFSLLQVLALKWINPPFTLTMLLTPSPAGKAKVSRQWRSLETISPHLVTAVMAAEDQRFLEHRGFDWTEIINAIQEAQAGFRVRGASTISMQVARNVFLWTGHSALRKALELYYTFWLEQFLSKRRIMTVYLNVVEWGRGIFGAEAAARWYFGVPASSLSRVQAAALAAVLPSPRRWDPTRPTKYLLGRRRFILNHMKMMPYRKLLGQ